MSPEDIAARLAKELEKQPRASTGGYRYEGEALRIVDALTKIGVAIASKPAPINEDKLDRMIELLDSIDSRLMNLDDWAKTIYERLGNL